jgi:hypothetical protein
MFRALNARLPIAFDARGEMESTYCAATRGSRSRSMARSTYRMPSRGGAIVTDRLLQENGYWVLRFLARTWGKSSIRFSMPFCADCHSAGEDCHDGRLLWDTQTGTSQFRDEGRPARVLRLQRLEPALEIRFTALRGGDISQIDEQIHGAVVARGLFRRDQALDLFPRGRLSPCEVTEVLRARQCRLGLASRPLDFGSCGRVASPFIAGGLPGAQK